MARLKQQAKRKTTNPFRNWRLDTRGDWDEYERRKAALRERSYRGEISQREYEIGIQRIVKELEL